MAKDKDDIPTLTLEVLKDIRGDMREMKGDIKILNTKVETLTERVEALNGRFDHFLEFGGEAHRELDRRVAKLESHVFGSGAGTP